MKKFHTLLLICAASTGYSQEGFGTSNPAPSSVIDMVASNKGALLPRVTLSSTAIAAPVPLPANALTVFNTATTGDVTPGYYYWSSADSKWIRLLNQDDVTEPWQVQNTTDKATTNTQNIYQTGSVAIGKNTALTGASLDVQGAVRGGSGNLGVVGLNSVAFGQGNTASGSQSAVSGGFNNIASGNYSNIGGGINNIASGPNAPTVSGGGNNQASGGGSTISGGANNTASGTISTVSGGFNNTAASYSEWVGGFNSTNYTPIDSTAPQAKDRLFNIGNGFGPQSDAFTILKGATTGIGFSNFEAVPFNEMLQVNGNARFAALPSITGDVATDKVVVADADGVLKTVAVADITPAETNTTLSIAAGQLVYTNEEANNANVNLVSADTNNTLVAGTDGRLFVPESTADNIYTADGMLTGSREVDMDGNSLTFKGTEGHMEIETGGNAATLHSTNTDRARFRLSTDDIDNDGVTSIFDMSLFSDNYMQMFGTGEMNGLSIGTHATQSPSPIEFVTSPGGLALGETRMTITGDGNVGIGGGTPSERLDIETGNVRIRDIVTNAGDVNNDRIVVANDDGVLRTLPFQNSNNWSISGNTSTNSSMHFLGTTDDQDLKFRVNNRPVGWIRSDTRTTDGGTISLGVDAGIGATDAYSAIFFGIGTGYNATNVDNSIFIGSNTGLGATNASSSIFIGTDVGNGAVNASRSTFIGEEAGSGAVNAANSIFIGTWAGRMDLVNNTLSSSSILIGNDTGTAGFKNSIALGTGAANTAENQLMIGGSGISGTLQYDMVNPKYPSSRNDSGTTPVSNMLYTDANGKILSAPYVNTAAAPEVDGVIGNEVTNATTNGGLTRAGAGTTVSPYTLGLTSGTTTGDLMTWNGTAWAPATPGNQTRKLIYSATTGNPSQTLTIGGMVFRINGADVQMALSSAVAKTIYVGMNQQYATNSFEYANWTKTFTTGNATTFQNIATDSSNPMANTELNIFHIVDVAANTYYRVTMYISGPVTGNKAYVIVAEQF